MWWKNASFVSIGGHLLYPTHPAKIGQATASLDCWYMGGRPRYTGKAKPPEPAKKKKDENHRVILFFKINTHHIIIHFKCSSYLYFYRHRSVQRVDLVLII